MVATLEDNLGVWGFLTKLNILKPHVEATELFYIYTKELKTLCHTKLRKDVYSSFSHNC